MYNSSSRSIGTARPNADGSQNVYCDTCGEFICRSITRINKATCALCGHVQAGERLTDDSIKLYQQGKPHATPDVNLLVVPAYEQSPKKFKLRAMSGMFLDAIGLKKKPKPMPKSVKIVREQKKGRLFEGVSLGNNMESLDKELKKDQ